MSSDPAEPAWRLVRTLGGVAAGLVVLFGVVLVSSWLATLAAGLGPDDEPTNGYLLLNLGGSFAAAVLAGMVAASVGRALIAPAILAVLLLATGVAAGGQVAQGPSAWYPVAVTLAGAGGVVLGGILAPRRGAHARAAGAG